MNFLELIMWCKNNIIKTPLIYMFTYNCNCILSGREYTNLHKLNIVFVLPQSGSHYWQLNLTVQLWNVITLTWAHVVLFSAVNAPSPCPGGCPSHLSLILCSWSFNSGCVYGSPFLSIPSSTNILLLQKMIKWIGE